MDNTPYLFVYGSLRKGFQSEAYQYISTYFELVGTAKTKGFLIDMGDYPAGIPTDSENYIIGELYKLKNENEFNWAFAQIDDYEGVIVEANEVPGYERIITKVVQEEATVSAWVYWSTAAVNGKPVITSGDIMDYLQNKK
jgi:gamma-glutamylcyclotransferase (GGCT)/AIG2-like uncharacterized protein YtfP